MKKLYRATVEFEFFVVADDEEKAEMTALEWLDEAASMERHCVIVDEVDSINNVAPEWRKSLPYGKDDSDRTCEQILAASAATV